MLKFYIISIYLLGGFLMYGFEFAFWQREYPMIAEENRDSNIRKSLWGAVVWPCNIVAFFLFFLFFQFNKFKFHGFKWR